MSLDHIFAVLVAMILLGGIYYLCGFITFLITARTFIRLDKLDPNVHPKEPNKAAVVWSALVLAALWPVGLPLILLFHVLWFFQRLLAKMRKRDFADKVYKWVDSI